MAYPYWSRSAKFTIQDVNEYEYKQINRNIVLLIINKYKVLIH